jgi:uncharacterized protein YcbK (DUF882 family)
MKPSKFSSRVMGKADWDAIADYFLPGEFTVPTRMGWEFMLWLVEVRKAAGVPMHISSSYRTAAHNKAVGGAMDSAHTDAICNAVDIGIKPTPEDRNWNAARFEIMDAARALGCQRIGMYKNGSLHIDRTEDVRPARCIWVAVDNPA